jgi:hypothetical protein
VAAYPFTTRNPYVGMVEYDDYLQVAGKFFIILFMAFTEQCRTAIHFKSI